MGFVGEGQDRGISVLFRRRRAVLGDEPDQEVRPQDWVEMGGEADHDQHRGAATSTLLTHSELFGKEPGLLAYANKETTSVWGTAISKITGIQAFRPVFGDSPPRLSQLLIDLRTAVPGGAPLFSDGSWAKGRPLSGFMRGALVS